MKTSRFTLAAALSAPLFFAPLAAPALSAQTPRLVTDLFPGFAGGGPSAVTDVAGSLWFSGNDGTHGYELWRSDGTASGTVMIADLRTGPVSSNPFGFTQVAGKVFFTATTDLGGELLISDGTPTGTRIVRDLFGRSSPSPDELTPFHGRLYFLASPPGGQLELWQSDGTETGTVKVVDLGLPGPSVGFVHLVAARDRLYYVVGNANGTWTLKTSLGDASSEVSLATLDDFREPTVVGDRLFFRGTTGAAGQELWTSDGTSAGTDLVMDLLPGPNSGEPTNLVAFDDRVLFSAFEFSSGRELWSSDGTAAGTSLVADIRPGTSSSMPAELTRRGDLVLFAARDSSSGTELWSSDGTAAGTVRVADIRSGFGSSEPHDFLAVGNRYCWFAANDGSNGEELWRTDGTAAGTTMAGDVSPGRFASLPRSLCLAGGKLFYGADDGTNGYELWVVDDAGSSVKQVGQPWPVAGRRPGLWSSDPVLGTTWNLEGRGTIPGSTALPLLGVERLPVSSPFGGGFFYLDIGSALSLGSVTSGGDGSWDLGLSLPNDPGLLALSVAVQGAVVTPSGDVEMTEGLVATVSD